jgi:hypothetical protein
MPGQGRKRSPDGEVAPVLEGEVVPATLEELDEPAGREGNDELDGDAVEMNEDEDEDDDDEDEDEDEDEDDEDEDEDDEDDEEADEPDDR